MFFFSKSKEVSISIASRNRITTSNRLQEINTHASNLETGIYESKNFVESALVMENIFRSTIESNKEENIQIYAHHLNGDYSAHGLYMKMLHHFFAKTNHTIEVLIDKKPINSPHAIKAYDLLELYSKSKRFKNRLSFKMIRPEKHKHLSLYLESCECTNHFMTSTSSMFFLEENKRTATASYSFCHEEKTNSLQAIFNFIFEDKNGFTQTI